MGIEARPAIRNAHDQWDGSPPGAGLRLESLRWFERGISRIKGRAESQARM